MCFFFFQAEDGIRDLVRSRGLGDVYKRQDYADRDKWNRMAVINTAMSGVFCSDRTIREYNDTIWHLDPLKRKV